MAIVFDKDFQPQYGRTVPVTANIVRITVNNPGPFTFHGTNSYIVGTKSLCVIDPGPEDPAHFSSLMDAIAGRPVTHIFVSHTHRDHSPLAVRLKAKTGATIIAQGPHRPARPLNIGEINPLDAAADTGFVPDIAIGDGASIAGDGWSLTAIHTPGHTANHLAFALDSADILFSADHVMAWATSIVAPPDGAMADYMASLDALLARDDRLYLPGHGGAVTRPRQFVRALKTHRLMRERAILQRIGKGDRTVSAMVSAIYRDTDPRLHGAAALSVLAHLEDLVARRQVSCDGPPAIGSEYRPG